jgi:CCR4-NOT transcription complex subunit 1
LKSKLAELATTLKERPPEPLLNELLMFIFSSSAFEQKQRENIVKALAKLFPDHNTMPRLMAVLLGDGRALDGRREFFSKNSSDLSQSESILKSIYSALGPVSVIEDLGYDCMADSARFSSALKQFARQLDEEAVARLLGMMAMRHPVDDQPDPLSAALLDAKSTGWNLDVFVSGVASILPNLDWASVVRKLDYPEFKLIDLKGAVIIAQVFRRATTDPFPVKALLQRWTHVAGQVSFLRFACAAPELFAFATQTQRIAAIDVHPPAAAATNPRVMDIVQTWYSSSLVETLLTLSAENGYYTDVLAIFEFPRTNCPEVLVLALAEAEVQTDLRMELLASLIAMFMITNHPNSATVLLRLWQMNRMLIVDNMELLYSRDPSQLGRILDVAQQELRDLKTVLSVKPYHVFTMDLAALAARREHLFLDKWIADMIQEHSDLFVRSILQYVKRRLETPDASVAGPTIETIQMFLRSIGNNSHLLTPPAQQELQELLPVLSMGSTAPTSATAPVAATGKPIGLQQLLAGAAAAAAAAAAPTAAPAPTPGQELFPKEIEDVANQYFTDIYEEKLSIDDLIQILKEFRNSRNVRDQKIYACMIHNLFDEYRFFPKYPDKELLITGMLFGALIQHRLISALPLGFALRYVLDALKKPPVSKMFKFGIVALEQFKSRLIEWPQYCAHIIQIPHMHQIYPELMKQLQNILTAASTSPGGVIRGPDGQPVGDEGSVYDESSYMMQPNEGQSRMVHDAIRQEQAAANALAVPAHQTSDHESGAASTAPGGATGLNTGSVLPLNTLLRGMRSIEHPDEATADRIHFILNNVSSQNMESKADELRKILKQQHFDYLAHYLVGRRVSTESNFHKLYLSFLEYLKEKDLMKRVIEHSIIAARSVLQSPKIRTSIQERTLLKNLGTWIGLLTLGRNKPLYFRDLPLKELMLAAYEKGSLIAVVPFVSKIMSSCSLSKIFRVPNPWVMAILKLFVELYNVPDIRTPIQFEIELLFRGLEIDMETIAPSELLRARRPYTGNDVVDFNNPPRPPPADEGKPQLVGAGGLPPGQNAASNIAGLLGVPPASATGAPPGLGGPAAASISSAAAGDLNVTAWMQYITISPKLVVFNQLPELKRVCYVAINRAVEEIIEPVVDRVVTIASTTTQKLTLKDFAMEPDESKLLHAARCMVQSLSSSLANVICKEPLRVSILNHLRLLLKDVTLPADQALLDFSLQTVVAENLDTACEVIEKVATERAVTEVKEQLNGAVEARKAHREQQRLTGSTQPYYDINFFSGRYPSALPEILRGHFGGVQAHQLSVYEEFLQRNPATAAAAAAAAAAAGLQPTLAQQQAAQMGPAMGATFGVAAPTAEVGVGAAAAAAAQLGGTQLPPGAAALFGSSSNASQAAPITKVDANFAPIGTKTVGNELGAAGVREVSSSPPIARPTQPAVGSAQIPAAAAAPVVAENQPTEPLENAEAAEQITTALTELEQAAIQPPFDKSSISAVAADHPVLGLVRNINNFISRAKSPAEVATPLAQRVVKHLLDKCRGETENSLLRDALLAVLYAFVTAAPKLKKDITSLVVYESDDKRYNRFIIHGLLRHRTLKVLDMDVTVAKQLDKGRNKVAVEFAWFLVRKCLLEDHVVNPSELVSTLEELERIVARLRDRNAPDAEEKNQAMKLVKKEMAEEEKRKKSGDSNPAGVATTLLPVPGAGALKGAHPKVAALFSEWIQLSSQPAPPADSVVAQYIQQLQQLGFYGSTKEAQSEAELSFYRSISEAAVAFYLQQAPPASDGASNNDGKEPYQAVDALAKLIVVLVKYYPEKVVLLGRIFGQVANVMNSDFQSNPVAFNQRPYFRLFANLLVHFNQPDPAFDSQQLLILAQFGEVLHVFQPKKYPGFAFAWLELVSHRMFMPKLLREQRGWPVMHKLVVELLDFLEPFLRKAKLPPEIRFFYKGTLRVLLVLLHDFPEFLCDYHFSFCDVLPPTCIQLRNLILSAFPRAMKLPDPFTPNLKVDLLPEIKEPPPILANYSAALVADAQLKTDLEQFLRVGQREAHQFLADLPDRLILPAVEAQARGTRYNVPLINSLVLCTGVAALADPSRTAPMELFLHLAVNLDNEGRYVFFNSIANQLRYPNNHTHYFSCVLLFLFQEAQQEVVQEQITRVLLERLIAHRPHPWGLLITFIELIKNQRYNFWSRPFTRCTPEIERLFISVARSCMPQSNA